MEYFKKILFIATSDEEAKSVIDSFNMVELEDDIDPGLPAKWYVAIQAKMKLYLLVSAQAHQYGVTRCGTQNATLLTWEGLRTMEADIVVSVGYATGIGRAKLGDIYLCNQAKYFDREFDCDENNEEMSAYAIGNYHCIVPSKVSFSYQLGIIASGNSCSLSFELVEELEKDQVCLIDMSTAAIAEVCEIRSKPLVVLKGVHQLIGDEGDESQIPEEGVQALSEAMDNALNDIVQWAKDKLIPPVKKKNKNAKYFKAFSFRRFKKNSK